MQFFCYILISTQAFIQKLLSEEYESTKNELRKNQEKTLLFLDITKADTKYLYKYIDTIAIRLNKKYTFYKISADDRYCQYYLNKLFKYINKYPKMQSKNTHLFVDKNTTYKLSCKSKFNENKLRLNDKMILELFIISDLYVDKSTQYLINDLIIKNEVKISKFMIFVFSDNIKFDYLNVLQQIYFQNMTKKHEYRDHPFYLYYMPHEDNNDERVQSIQRNVRKDAIENQMVKDAEISLLNASNIQHTKIIRNSDIVNRSNTSHDLKHGINPGRIRATLVGNKNSCCVDSKNVLLEKTKKSLQHRLSLNGFFANIIETRCDFSYIIVNANSLNEMLNDTKTIKCIELSYINEKELHCKFSSPVCSTIAEKLFINNESCSISSFAYFKDKYKNDFEDSSSNSSENSILDTTNTKEASIIYKNYNAAPSNQRHNYDKIARGSLVGGNSGCFTKTINIKEPSTRFDGFENTMDRKFTTQESKNCAQSEIADLQSAVINQIKHSFNIFNTSELSRDSKNDIVIDKKSNNYNKGNDKKKSFTDHIYENFDTNKNVNRQHKADPENTLPKDTKSECHCCKNSDRYFEIINLDENNSRSSRKKKENKNFDKLSVNIKKYIEQDNSSFTDRQSIKIDKDDDYDYTLYSKNVVFSTRENSFYDKNTSYYITKKQFIKNNMKIILQENTEVYFFKFDHKIFDYKIKILITISKINKKYYLHRNNTNARELTVYDILQEPSNIIFRKFINPDNVDSELMIFYLNMKNLYNINLQQRRLNAFELFKSRITQLVTCKNYKTNMQWKTAMEFKAKIDTFFSKHKNSYTFKICSYRLKRSFVCSQNLEKSAKLYKYTLNLNNAANITKEIFINKNVNCLIHNTRFDKSLQKYDDRIISFAKITDVDCLDISAACNGSLFHNACPLYEITNKEKSYDENSYLLFDNTEKLSKAVEKFSIDENLKMLFDNFFDSIIMYEESGGLYAKKQIYNICYCFFICRCICFYEELFIYDYNDSNYVEEYINVIKIDPQIKEYIGFVLIRFLKSYRKEFYRFYDLFALNTCTNILLDMNDLLLINTIINQWPEKK